MPVDTEAWTTLANVKEHMQQTGTTYDALLTNMINRSYKILEKYIGRQMYARSYTEYQDGDGSDMLLTEQWPINSVTTLHDDIDRAFGSDALIASTDYVIYGAEGKIRLIGTGSFRFGYGPVFSRGIQNIKLVYNAGYTDIPGTAEDLEAASIIHVAHMFNKSAAEGHTSMSLGGLAKTYDPKAIPEEIKFILEPYRKRAV